MLARPWSPEEYSQAVALRNSGAMYREIAASLGRPYFNVYHRLTSKAPERKWWTDEKQEKLKELWLSGAKMTAIAEELGTTRGSVAGRLDRMGLFRNPARPKPVRPPRQPTKSRPWALRKHYARKALPDMVPAPDALRLSVPELEAKSCRFIVTDDHPMLYCGHEAADGFSYCAFHCGIVYRPAEARERNARPR